MAKTTRINTKDELFALPNGSKLLFVIKKTMAFYMGTVCKSDEGDIFLGIDVSGMTELNPDNAYIFKDDIRFNKDKITIEDIRYSVYLFEMDDTEQ